MSNTEDDPLVWIHLGHRIPNQLTMTRMYHMLWEHWDRDGQMVVIGTGDKYELIARNPIGESSHATPAVGDGSLFVRTPTRLIAIGR